MAGLSSYIQANYPSPNEGDTFLWGGVRYVYDSTPGVWVGQLPQPDAVTDAATTSTAPAQPNEGDLWYDGTVLNVRVGDVWRVANPQPTAETLGIGPVLVVQKDGSQVTTETTSINFTTRIADDAAVNVTGTTSNQAEVEIVFPNQASQLGIPPAAPTPSASSVTNSILQTPAMGSLAGPTWVPLPPIPTSISDLGTTSINDISNVDATSPGMDDILQFNGTNWVPATIPTATSVMIDSEGNTVTIGGVDTEIPVVTGGSFNDTTNILSFQRNGTADFTVNLSSLASGSTQPVTPILSVNGVDNVSAMTFDSNFSITGSAGMIQVGAPTPPTIAVSENGMARTNAVSNLNFVSGATVSHEGGVTNVTIDPTVMGSQVQTTYSNTRQAGTLVSSVGQASNNRSEFTLTGGAGGSRYRTMFRSTATGATLRWTSADASNINNFTVWGNRTFGLWDSSNRHVALLQAPPNGADILWTNAGVIGLQDGEVIMVEVELSNNGSITFNTSSASDITWDSSEQNTAIGTGDTTTNMVEPVIPQDEPAGTPPVTASQPYPDTEPNMCGPYWLPNPPDTSENDFIIWDGADGAAVRNNGSGLKYSTLTGGDGSASASSTNGNSIWGVNQNRFPAGGIFIGQVQTLIPDSATISFYTNITNMLTILLPHEDECGVAQYLRDTVTDPAAWQNHPIYTYDALGGSYGGASADRRIAAWITQNSTTGQPTTYLNPSTAGVDQMTGALTNTDYPGFVNGSAVTTTNRFLGFTSRSIVGARWLTDSDSGMGGPFGDQLKLNLNFGDRQFTSNLNDFGNRRYSPPGSVEDIFKTQFLTVVPGTTNVLYIEARSSSSPIRWSGENNSGNRVNGFEIGYRLFTPNTVGTDVFDVGTNSDGNWLDSRIRQADQITELQ